MSYNGGAQGEPLWSQALHSVQKLLEVVTSWAASDRPFKLEKAWDTDKANGKQIYLYLFLFIIIFLIFIFYISYKWYLYENIIVLVNYIEDYIFNNFTSNIIIFVKLSKIYLYNNL